MSWHRTSLPFPERPELEKVDTSSLAADMVVTENGGVTITGSNFVYAFNSSGFLSSMSYGGNEYIYKGNGPKYDNFRYIENDTNVSSTPSVGTTDFSYEVLDGTRQDAAAVKVSAVHSAGYPRRTGWTTPYIRMAVWIWMCRSPTVW